MAASQNDRLVVVNAKTKVTTTQLKVVVTGGTDENLLFVPTTAILLSLLLTL